MSDTEAPAADTQEQQQAAVVEDTSANSGDAAAEAPKENGDSQDAQEASQPQPDDGGENDGKAIGDVAPAEGDGGSDGDAARTGGGDGGDDQQPAAEERQATPAVPAEEQSQEPAPDCNGTPKEPEDAPEEEPEAEPETEAEPEVEQEPVEAREQQQARAVTLTEEQMKLCRHYFEHKALNGRLDLKGFKMLCRLMGEVLSADDASQMFEDGDRDDDGTIDFDEFCRLYGMHSQEEHSRKAAMMESIDKLFPGMDGRPVELKKVKHLLLKMQRPDLDMRLVREKSDLNPGDIHRLVKTMDKDGNGLISKQEFVDTLCKHLDHA